MTVGIGEWRPEKNGDFGRFGIGDLALDLKAEAA